MKTYKRCVPCTLGTSQGKMYRIRKNASFLKALSGRGNAAFKRQILKKASRAEICTICELSKNILKGRVSLTQNQKRKLCRYKRALRRLADRKLSYVKKKRFLLQRGGLPILPLILGAVAPLIGKLVSKIIPDGDGR